MMPRLRAVGYRSFPALGAPPPPLAGEGWGGGRGSEVVGARVARLALFALLSFLVILPALALVFPTLSGRVVDEAGVLDEATRAALTQKLADLEAKTTDQLVVVTLKSLQGTTIEDLGYQLGRHWRIGQQDKNNGALLIVAPTDRQVRIEVGYGLEGTLTDAVSKLIIENGILPRFRANDVPGGISRGVDDIISVLTGDAEEWKQRAAQRPDTVTTSPSTQKDTIWTIIVVVLIIVVVVIICSTLLGALCDMIFAILQVVTLSSGKGGGSSGGGFSGGGGSFGGGGASGRW
jgi:uncharacterized protein